MENSGRPSQGGIEKIRADKKNPRRTEKPKMPLWQWQKGQKLPVRFIYKKMIKQVTK